MAKISQAEDDEDEDDMADSAHASLKQLQSILTSLTRRLIETEMEDFEIVSSCIYLCFFFFFFFWNIGLKECFWCVKIEFVDISFDKTSIVFGTNAGMGNSGFYLNSIFFKKLFRAEIIAFSSGNSHLISSLQVFYPFPAPIPANETFE